MVNKEIGTVYLCIHKKLKEYSKERELPKKWVLSMLAKSYHIPKPFGVVVLREMEHFDLIKDCTNKEQIEVINCETEIDSPSVIYNRVGLF